MVFEAFNKDKLRKRLIPPIPRLIIPAIAIRNKSSLLKFLI